jgi:amino acid transporter
VNDHPRLRKRAMSGTMLAMTIFCCVSGGPFGLEPLIGATGAGFALVLILAMPLLWALPDSLITAELAPAIPVEGGYVIWVRRAMGPFAAFVNAWWTWIYAMLDASIYPVLFSTYFWAMLKVAGVGPIADDPRCRWLTAVVVIAVFSSINIRGTKLVGRASGIFTLLIVAPFAIMVVIGLVRLGLHPQSVGREFLLPGISPVQGLSGGLAIVLWNYLGWDSLSTIAEEVDDPGRAYPRAIFTALLLITAAYVLPVVVGLAFYPDASKWTEGAWPEIARAVGGSWLALPVQIAALVSPIALFTASLLASSRVPFVLAEERFLPKALVKIHPRFGTPWIAIMLCSVVYACFAFESFEDLVELNVIMYASALVLESLSLLILRYKEPGLRRPFKIPGGIPVVAIVVTLPVMMAGLLIYAMAVEAVQNTDRTLVRNQLLIMGSLLVSAPLLYGVIKVFRGTRHA